MSFSSLDRRVDHRADTKWPLALFIAGIVVALFGGCGGSDETLTRSAAGAIESSEHQPVPRIDRAQYLKRAEAICSRSAHEIHALGRALPRVFSQSGSYQKAITNGLVRPGIEILNTEAARLRSLGPAPSSRESEVFLGLFDPIIELAHERLRAGNSGDPEHARTLELMIASLEDEQSAAARGLGLHACSLEFTHALGGSE